MVVKTQNTNRNDTLFQRSSRSTVDCAGDTTICSELTQILRMPTVCTVGVATRRLCPITDWRPSQWQPCDSRVTSRGGSLSPKMAAQSKRTDQVLIRSPLNEGFGREEPPLSLYSNSFPQRHYPQNTRLQRLHPGRFPKNSFFARNNPHPGRVTHIKGLLDAPICCVQDGVYDGHRLLLSEPMIDPRLLETGMKPKGATRYSANKDKLIPAVGIGEFVYSGVDGCHGS